MAVHQLSICLLLLAQRDASIEEVVARQQSTLGLLWAMEMDVDVYYSETGDGKVHDPPIHMWHYHWARDPNREREHYRQLAGETSRNRQPINLGDFLDDGNSRRTIMNWDYEKNGTRIPAGWTPVQASIGQRSRQPPRIAFANPLATALLQAVQPQRIDVVRSLREFVAESPSVSLKPMDGSDQVMLVATHPDDRTGGQCKGCLTYLTFDPQHGGLICKQRGEAPAGAIATVPTYWEAEIVKWDQPKPGAFLPMETSFRAVARAEAGEGEKVVAVARMVVSKVRVNESVPESAFKLTFPENAVVADLIDPTRPRYHLWGAEDKPVATSEDRSALPNPLSIVDDGRTQWRPWIGPICVSALVLGLVGLWIYRKRQRL